MGPARAKQDDELLLSIGAVVGGLSLHGAPPTFIEQARARYDAFTLPPAEWVNRAFALDLRFESTRPGIAGATHRDAAATMAAQAESPLTVSVTDRAIRIQRWDFVVRLSAAPTGRGPVRWSGSARCEMNPFALDSLLRVLWSIFLPMEGGALVHACGLRHGEIGVVFPGASGAGKTTLARKAPDADDVLSDEIVALRPAPAGAVPGWRVYGTPFWGEFARGGISMRSWPLRCLGFLAQRPGVAMAPITSAEATMRLLSCFVCFQTDDAAVRRNLAVAAQLCSEVRAVEAQLTRAAATAEIFRKLAPHLGTEVTRKDPPPTTREMISEFRAFLRKNRSYASQSKGRSMRPFLKPGDSLFVQAAGEAELSPGDILLFWSPGKKADDDVLICHRLVGRVPSLGGHGPRYLTKGDAVSRIEAFENQRQSEILGKVSAVSRDGRTVPVPGRVANLARLFGSLLAMPLQRMAGR